MPECTDLDCIDFDHTRHTFLIDCTDIAGGCPCTNRPSRTA
ncbi:hypothetical protein [Nocardia sp. NPDC005366]